MSNKITSLSSIEIEAVAHFHNVAKALGIPGGQFGPLEIAKGDYLDGKYVQLETDINGIVVTGWMFFQKPDNTWTFCGWTNNQFTAEGLGWRAEFRFWEDENGSRYEIKKRYLAGGRDMIEVKIETSQCPTF